MNTVILILFALAIIYLVVLVITAGLTGKLSFSTGSFDLPVLLVAIVYLISSIFVSPNIMDTLILPGTTSVVILATIIYFLVNQSSSRGKIILSYILYSLGVIYSLLVLLAVAKVTNFFSLDGQMLQSAIFLTALIPFAASFIVRQKQLAVKALIVASLFVLLFALSALVFSININRTREINHPDFKTSSQILVATLRENPVFGIGSGNYLESFNKFRPIEYNNTPIWANKFNHGASYILTLTTETGAFGVLVFMALLASFILFFSKNIKNKWIDLITPLMLFVFVLLLPILGVNLILLFIALAIVTDVKKHDHIITSKVVSVAVMVPIMLLISIVVYKVYPLSSAELTFSKALVAIHENRAKDAYDLNKKAINLNSKVDRYHKTMSSINLAIANSLDEQSETDKNEIPLFVQESINEAKAAVALNNRKSENWELLGKTYKLLIPFADGADQFAVDAYKQAIVLDPISPNLRISLGEIYMLKKDYKLAIETFNLAVLAKGDHPNAHFNLAHAYKESGNLENAKLEFERTLTLVDVGSNDYEKVTVELNKFKTP